MTVNSSVLDRGATIFSRHARMGYRISLIDAAHEKKCTRVFESLKRVAVSYPKSRSCPNPAMNRAFCVSWWSLGWKVGEKARPERGRRTRNRGRKKRDAWIVRIVERGWRWVGVKENAVVCSRTRLCNPFRESAERGTQTPEWGKNSVSSPSASTPAPHPFSAPSRFHRLASNPVSHGSRLRGNQAKHKLGRRIVAGNIYKPWNLREKRRKRRPS